VDEPVRGAADRLQHDLGVAEGARRQDVGGARPAGDRHLGRAFAARLGDADALGMGRRHGGAERQRQPERLGDAGHGRGRAHDHAGADRGRQPAADHPDLLLVDLAGPVRAQRRRQSVQAPSTSPLWWPTTIGPTGTTIAGRSTSRRHDLRRQRLVAPPITTTESMGWARIISSVSIAMRFRRYIEVGWAKLSWIEIVGNTIGMAPASMTPRFTASISWGALPWHGL
jgi:hypothetical protein